MVELNGYRVILWVCWLVVFSKKTYKPAVKSKVSSVENYGEVDCADGRIAPKAQPMVRLIVSISISDGDRAQKCGDSARDGESNVGEVVCAG
ncbi:hypothetical protein P0D88_22975 [Paraburkholderia sp. RL18-103-BIB-C]|uniref:hypothetical protein n=1 Tax=unclassified Paraburkholderia TaxID=2615204 RepID=UPI0038B6CB26